MIESGSSLVGALVTIGGGAALVLATLLVLGIAVAVPTGAILHRRDHTS